MTLHGPSATDSAAVAANAEVPASPQAPRKWLGQVPRDVVLIVVGAAIAFGSEEWRDARSRRARVDVAVASIRDELAFNRRLVAAAREHHRYLADTLGTLAARRLRPDVAIYSNGMFNPAAVTSTAWQAARETGALNDIPLATVLAIAPAYEAQDRYRNLSEAMGTAIMADVRRDGMDVVLRDRFAQFVPLDMDFSNREGRLLETYDQALARITELRAPSR